MKTSIVPELLNNRGIRIFDDNNVEIRICEDSKVQLSLNYFKNPFIIIDNMELGKGDNIETKKIVFSDLERLNLKLVTIDLRSASRGNMRNRRGQKVCYMIKQKTASLEGAREIFKMPREHILEMDITNKRIRIRGVNSYPYVSNENASKWVEINDDQ